MKLLPVLMLASAALVTGNGPLPDPLEAGWQGVPVCKRLHENDRHRVLKCTFASTLR